MAGRLFHSFCRTTPPPPPPLTPMSRQAQQAMAEGRQGRQLLTQPSGDGPSLHPCLNLHPPIAVSIPQDSSSPPPISNVPTISPTLFYGPSASTTPHSFQHLPLTLVYLSTLQTSSRNGNNPSSSSSLKLPTLAYPSDLIFLAHFAYKDSARTSSQSQT